MTKEKAKSTTAHCNKCEQPTNHNILASKDVDRVEQIPCPNGGTLDMHNSTAFQVVECCGCGDVSFRKSFWLEEWGDEVEETYYPPRVSRRFPLWYEKLPPKIGSLLSEVYTALHADSRTLAMMGARALIDLTATDKVGDLDTFKKKLEALEEKGYTSSRNAEVLNAAIEAGHAAAHRGHVPEPDDLNNVIDIVENLLQTVYVLEPTAESLKKKTPRRPRKNRDSSTKTSDDASGTSETKD